MKNAIIVFVVCLIAGVVGYAVAYLIYTPQIRAYAFQVSDLTGQVNTLVEINHGLEQTIDDQETTITNNEGIISAHESLISLQQTTINKQEAKISTLQSETASLRSQLLTAESNAVQYKEQLSNTEKALSGVQSRLNDVLGITVTQNYQWEYEWSTWYWDLPISLSEYVEFKDRTRPQSLQDLIAMAKEPNDDEYITAMVDKINNASTKAGYNEAEKLNFVIAFVQSLPYTVDIETTPYDEYPRYPIETLFDRGGDCEDTSILVAALLDAMGYDVALLILKNARHAAVGVALTNAYGSYYEYEGKKYFYLETTGEGWQIGQIPPDFSDARAEVLPL